MRRLQEEEDRLLKSGWALGSMQTDKRKGLEAVFLRLPATGQIIGLA